MSKQLPYKINSEQFNFIADLVHKNSGIHLTADKEYLVESRLEPIVKNRGLDTIGQLVYELQTMPTTSLVCEIVDAMTTGETMFYRDGRLFSYLSEQVLPDLRRQAKDRGSLRFGRAAASTGQEAYSIAMMLLDKPTSTPLKHEIIATDINQKVLDKANKGIYTSFEVQRGLNDLALKKHFNKLPSGEWQIKDEARNMITFYKHNLMQSFENKGLFDVIFCRNVLIYFNETTKNSVINRLCENLHPGGLLILGGSEFLSSSADKLKNLDGIPGLYQRI
jgi:chemotaxis protein methyltransferase CheR